MNVIIHDYFCFVSYHITCTGILGLPDRKQNWPNQFFPDWILAWSAQALWVDSVHTELLCVPLTDLSILQPPSFGIRKENTVTAFQRNIFRGLGYLPGGHLPPPKFGHLPPPNSDISHPPKKNICQEDNCHPHFFFFFGALFLAFST